MTRETNTDLAAAASSIAMNWAPNLGSDIELTVVDSLPSTGLFSGENSPDAVKFEFLVTDGRFLDADIHERIRAVTGLKHRHFISYYRSVDDSERTRACVFTGSAIAAGIAIAAEVPVEVHLRVKDVEAVA